MAGSARAAAAKTTAPKSDKVRADNVAPGTPDDHVAGPIRTQAEIETERRRVQPHQASGPGSGTRLLAAPERDADGGLKEQAEVDISRLADTDDASTLVKVKEDVYEELPAPGAPGRTTQRLLFHRGQMVPKRTLDRHIAAQRAAAKAKESAAKPAAAGTDAKATGDSSK